MRDLPSGTVTFLFTDVEGSTKLLHELGADGYAGALAEHRQILREVFKAHAGVEVDTQGDAFFFAFATAPGALEASATALAGLAGGPISVRIGVHTGTPLVTDEGYVGEDVHRAARIAACGHGGQVLVSATTAALLQIQLRDLGEHRLKDLSAPERIYQLGDSEFPALKSLYRTNLPVPATPFLGREQELAQVVEMLSQDDVRLVTLTGPGGTGKTRLALQAAAEVSDRFPDGVWWAPLSRLRDPELLLSAVADAVEADVADQPVIEAVSVRVGGRRALVLLDNAEHLLPQAAIDIAALVNACPNVVFLATSRESLRLSAEHEHPIGPLSGADAVRLFLHRAAAAGSPVSPSPALEELCRRLDDLPLALELAVGRLKLFTPDDLLARLGERLDLLRGGRDADPRQQTLRATLQWSYDLLEPDERRLFRGLSIFRGGCTYDLAEHVCGADPDALQSLLEKNLMRRRETDSGARYSMLETIRPFAREFLDSAGEADELCERHALAYLELTETSRRALRGPEQGAWRRRMVAEEDDLRAALEWSIDAPRPEFAQRLAHALEVHWVRSGRTTEAIRWLDRVLAIDGGATVSRARALATGGIFAPDERAAEERFERSIPMLREYGDDEGLAFALRGHAWLHQRQGRLSLARSELEEAIALFKKLGHTVTTRLLDLGGLALDEGDRDAARQWFERGLQTAKEEGDLLGAAQALANLGNLALDDGDLDEAERSFHGAISTVGDVVAILADGGAIAAIGGLAVCALRRSDPQRAGLLAETATELSKPTENSTWPVLEIRQRQELEDVPLPHRAAFEHGRAKARRAVLDDVIGGLLEEARRG